MPSNSAQFFLVVFTGRKIRRALLRIPRSPSARVSYQPVVIYERNVYSTRSRLVCRASLRGPTTTRLPGDVTPPMPQSSQPAKRTRHGTARRCDAMQCRAGRAGQGRAGRGLRLFDGDGRLCCVYRGGATTVDYADCRAITLCLA